jgi:hypothetical protein
MYLINSKIVVFIFGPNTFVGVFSIVLRHVLCGYDISRYVVYHNTVVSVKSQYLDSQEK